MAITVQKKRSPDGRRFIRMVIKDPFICRKPVKGEEFYGRKREIEMIFNHINKGESVSIVGPRRIGRTSLLLHLSLPDIFKKFGLNRRKYVLTYIDLRISEGYDKEEVFNLLVNELSKIANIQKDLCFDKSSKFNQLDEMFTFIIKNQNKKICFLLDEFESIAYNELIETEFYGKLRGLLNKYAGEVFYIVASLKPLDKIIKDAHWVSPLYNIFEEINIGCFTQEEAELLLSERGRLPKWIIELIIEEIGTQPFLLQIAGSCAFRIIQEKGDIRDLEYLKEEFMRRARSHFHYFFTHMTEKEKDIYQTISSTEKITHHKGLIENYRKSNPYELAVLVNSGVISRDYSRLIPWFDEGLRRLQTPSLPKDEIEIRDVSTTVLFADIIGSTQLADILPDEVYYQFLQEFDELVVNLSKEIGVKYYETYGDGLMYQFFDEDDKTCVMNALKAAVMIKERFSNSSFNQQRRKEGKSEFGLRFGIHTGLAKVGIYPGRTKPQAKGFMLNVAKRIEDEVAREAKNTKICLSEQSYELVKSKIEALDLGNFSLKGISFKIKVYELINFLT